MKSIQFSESIPVAASCDVLIAGGGVAGVAAALSAARNGAKVILLEKQSWLGGLATTGLINFWVPLCNGRGRLIIKGMAKELFDLSLRYGMDTVPPDWKNGEPDKPTDQRCVSWFSSGIFALQLLKILRDTGVQVIYDCLVSAPVMDGTRCCGLIIDGKSGRQFFEAKTVIDATGDADILLRAGVPTIDGDDYYTYIAEGITLDGCRKAVAQNNIHLAYYRPHGGPSSLYGQGHPEGMPTFKGCSMELVNDYLQSNQLLLLEKEKDKPRGDRNIHMLPSMIQLRTSRRIDGAATLTLEDCYHHCDTSIGVICDFDNRDRLFEVPYGTLYHKDYGNLLTCGRSASASGWGWDVLRVIPPAILTGQAAGLAAALACRDNCAAKDVNLPELQEKLADTGVVIHFPEAWLPADTSADSFAKLDGHM